MPVVLVLALREELRRLRAVSGLTQAQLAQKAGVEVTTIHRIENTKKMPGYTPDIDSIEKLSAAFDFPSVSEFFRRVEARPAETGMSLDTMTAVSAPGESHGLPLSSAQTEFFKQLAWACLRAADTAERLQAQAVLEELAVSFRRAADPTAGAQARADIREHRTRRRAG